MGGKTLPLQERHTCHVRQERLASTPRRVPVRCDQRTFNGLLTAYLRGMSCSEVRCGCNHVAMQSMVEINFHYILFSFYCYIETMGDPDTTIPHIQAVGTLILYSMTLRSL